MITWHVEQATEPSQAPEMIVRLALRRRREAQGLSELELTFEVDVVLMSQA